MNAITGSFTGRKRIRKSFGRIPEVARMPNLIDVQRSSYEAFLQMNVAPDSRTQTGLQEVFKSVFPIDDFAGRGRLEFVYYELEEPKYDVEECIQRGMTLSQRRSRSSCASSCGTWTRTPAPAPSGTSRNSLSTWATCRS